MAVADDASFALKWLVFPLQHHSTIHRSYGSEYASVIIPMLGGANSTFLSKEMLYTAITRARKNVILIGDGAFRACIEKGVLAAERHTLLKERLAEAI